MAKPAGLRLALLPFLGKFKVPLPIYSYRSVHAFPRKTSTHLHKLRRRRRPHDYGHCRSTYGPTSLKGTPQSRSFSSTPLLRGEDHMTLAFARACRLKWLSVEFLCQILCGMRLAFDALRLDDLDISNALEVHEQLSLAFFGGVLTEIMEWLTLNVIRTLKLSSGTIPPSWSDSYLYSTPSLIMIGSFLVSSAFEGSKRSIAIFFPGGSVGETSSSVKTEH